MSDRGIVRVPVLRGMCWMPRGGGARADHGHEDELVLPRDMLGRGSFFALRVTSESMAGAGILGGDTVIVRRRATARDGQIVLARAGDFCTLKRLRIVEGRRLLVPESPDDAFAVTELEGSAGGILGVLAGLVRVLPAG